LDASPGHAAVEVAEQAFFGLQLQAETPYGQRVRGGADGAFSHALRAMMASASPVSGARVVVKWL
jgi:hypothetical protein